MTTDRVLRSSMLHYGYPGRVSTAGNLAFPLSPSEIVRETQSGRWHAMFVAGSRDPTFRRKFEATRDAVVEALQAQHPTLHAAVAIECELGDEERPLAFVDTVENTPEASLARHRERCARLAPLIDSAREAHRDLDLGCAYAWSVHHLVTDPSLLSELFRARSMRWTRRGFVVGPERRLPVAEVSGTADDEHPFDDQPEIMPGDGEPVDRPLLELAHVIRSKNAGINELTYDILFRDTRAYRAALRSPIWRPKALCAAMNIDTSDLIACHAFEPALAIKFTVHRQTLCGGPGDRDVFGAQQHARLLGMRI